MSTQLYARIKRSSQYRHQATSSMPFPVSIGGYDCYIVRGNGNQYRVSDVTFFVRHNDRFIPLITSQPRKSHAADTD
jgi:hypothetical protein